MSRVVVLGGAGGIGRALVSSLLAQGDEVVVLDLPASLEAHPQDCPGVDVDVTSEAAVADAMAEVARIWPEGVDGFVNLAGWNAVIKPVTEIPTAHFDEVIEGNLRGQWVAAKAVLPLMREGGAMVLISSGLGQFIRPGFGPYAMSKAGVIALTKTLALECAPKLRVNAVAPAVVDTGFIRGGAGRSDERADSIVDLEFHKRVTPMGRVAVAEDIAGPIRFLLGPDSGFMTGQVLWVNGGAYMP